MNVEENEEIDRTIATILVIVTFQLTRPGRDWLTDLTDELLGQKEKFLQARNS
jgi:hypothetical protein